MTSAVLREALELQPRVQTFLERSLANDRVSHAFLLSGASAQARRDAALALAQSLVCAKGGCGTCDECRRAAHGTHPDISWLTPGSAAQGYLVEQVREVIQDAALSPVRAQRKIYVLSDAGRLGVQAANALLKTLEEPTDDVVFILEAPSAGAVLATVQSRCTVVPFAPQDPQQEARSMAQASQCDEMLARVALVVTGSSGNAQSYLASPDRLELRERVLGLLQGLAGTGDAELLGAAEAFVKTAEKIAEESGEQDEDERERDAEYLSKTALKEAEQRRKRQCQAVQRSCLLEVVRVVETALQDGLDQAMGAPDTPLNVTYPSLIAELALQPPSALLTALAFAREAERDLSRGLTPDLVLQIFLLRLKEALCPTFVQ